MSYRVAFAKKAEKEFLKLDPKSRNLVAEKIRQLRDGNFHGDKALQGRHKGKYRKRAGDYRIVYWREGEILLVTVIRIAHRREVH